MAKKTPAELHAIIREHIRNRGDKEQAFMALAELSDEFWDWLAAHNGKKFASFEAAWKEFSGEDWTK